MRSIKLIFSIILGAWLFSTPAFAYKDLTRHAPKASKNKAVSFRDQCTTAQRQIDQDVNNVRARLSTGGDVWWDVKGNGKYVVPKVPLGQKEVSSIFAGAVWLGGFDQGNNLKVACQTYGNSSGQSDFWPGPLSPFDGTTNDTVCRNWDKFFEVSGQEIDIHISRYRAARESGKEYTPDQIPLGVRGWPARRNPYFFSVHNFLLPDTDQGLAGFWDEDGDTFYDPLKGDYPIIEIRGCEEKVLPQYPDEMIFWIYNDHGGGKPHGETGGLAILMEVQVQAFGYATNDQVNDMTFQRYKLINRAKDDIDSTYFAMWVDADLGCYLDDYIGCDIDRSLAYTYNADAQDGQPGITCDQNVPTYGNEVPIIGVDYFRGPLNEFREELGMSSFTYFNNPSFGSPAPDPATTDPATAQEFYNYLSGSWRFGVPFTFGGSAYNPGSTNVLRYAFTDDPNKPLPAWSMCTANLPEYDRRTVQASGPFLLQPGAVNELIIGAVWVPDLDYPCPDISRLQAADDISQALFDNCFDITDGPDAPDVDWIELDQQLIAVLTNNPDTAINNNAFEMYEERDLQAPSSASDTTYNFEGYLIYQLAAPDVGTADFDNPAKARLIYQVDIKNGISTLYNWVAIPNPTNKIDPNSPKFIFIPEVKVQGADAGIRHTFVIKEDVFATGDRRLINHRKYYFSVKSYATNNYQAFDPRFPELGQKITYLEGRRNIKTYAPIPRPILDRKLNANYGDGPAITRYDGVGVGGNFVDITDETKAKILNGSFDGIINYKEGRGPIDVKIYNPLEVVDGEFEIKLIDDNLNDDQLKGKMQWQLTDLASGKVTLSERTLDQINEQILGEYGFTITIGQTKDAGDLTSPTMGVIGYDLRYKETNKPFWFSAIPNGFTNNDIPVFLNNTFRFVNQTSPYQPLAQIGDGYFLPYMICDYVPREYLYLTPALRRNGSLISRPVDFLPRLNNVDIVLTPDKSLWSRCVIVESANEDWQSQSFKPDGTPAITEGSRKHFDLRFGQSVGKNDADNDGRPDPDGAGLQGMGWFPGYAIDVESGERINIFFGENSQFHESNGWTTGFTQLTGRDMLFNPTDQILNFSVNNPMAFIAGGHHFIYMTNEKYDSCAFLRDQLSKPQDVQKVQALRRVTWTSLAIMPAGMKMDALGNGPTGLIPNEVTIKLRVDNPYQVYEGTKDPERDYPTYRFKIDGKQHDKLDRIGIENALDKINVVPNPYYAYSNYETSRLATVIKITNLPAKCVVTIYTLDGKFIRQYNRDEKPGAPNGSAIPSAQVIPDLEWDLKNHKGIPVAGGVYLIHVKAEDEASGVFGERTLKWFGVTRQYDPTGL